ncbi:hypothetical protein [Microbacterium sp. CIAB417]|uniref:hypothetical protein n=1 Tax=Microbacterium sp. CIAB417 TaxID=2860287 RepID=UPI001FAC4869|nr:hypothetical protein [Microbacterium sp. CIAB417]
MSTTPTPTRSDTLWRVTIVAIFVIGVGTAIAAPLLNGNPRSFLTGLPIIAFGILIAAIRSLKR